MAGTRRSTRVLLLAGAAVLAASTAAPTAVRGAGADETVVIPGGTILARVGDLDGDGVREVVRIVGGVVPGRILEIEAWRHVGGADWRASNRVTLPTRAADGQAGGAPEHQASLLPWSDGERTRMLALAGRGSTPFGFGAVADLSIWALSLDGSQLALEELPGAEGPARRVDAADLDGDGIDEIVVTAGGTRVDASADIRILSWSGDRFTALELDVGEARYPTEPVIGDSDGAGGDDVIIGLHTGTDLYRVTDDGSGIAVEHATLDLADAPPLAWPMAASDGAVYLFGDSPGGPHVVRVEWPRGGDPVVTATAGDRTFGWLEPVEHAAGIAFVDDPGFVRSGIADLDAVVRDAHLEEVVEVGSSEVVLAARAWIAATEPLATGFLGPFPYSGPLPGGVGGDPAYVRAGQLVVFGSDGVEIRDVASFIGVAPLGLAGVDEGWLLLSRGLRADGTGTYLHGLAPMPDGARLVPAEVALRPEADGGELPVELRDATRIGEGATAWVASADGGFDVVVRATPSARVGAVIAGRLAAQAEVGAEGVAELRLDPRPRRDDTVEYRATIVLLEPTGHAYSTTWDGVVIRDPAELEVVGTTVTGALEARLAGRSGEGSAVTVDHRPVATDRAGRFEVVVDAGLLPRDVIVRAVDPIGQEVVRRVQVVGLVDHRGWPWALIVGIATVLFGAGMYLRVPRGRGPRAIERGEGTIEEIDAR